MNAAAAASGAAALLPAGSGEEDEMKQRVQALWQDTQGQDLVEYALVAALVSVAAIATMPALGQTVSNVFSKVTSTLTSAIP
jgi:pilus assembly protein Flp/PilA